jgi:predicted dehydrogenase
MIETIGIGMIGYGGMGRVHAYCYRSLPFLYNPMPAPIELVGVAESSDDIAKLAKSQTGAQIVTADYQQLLTRKDIHVIDICVPNQLHTEVILAVVESGKHIYCEKPLCSTLKDAYRIAQAVKGSKQYFQMVFNYRFAPAILRARQLVEEGFLGDVISFEVKYLHSGYQNEARPMSWRLRKSESGGGALVDLGSHCADLLVYITGSRISRVYAEMRTLITRRREVDGSQCQVDVDDMALVMTHLENGASGIVEVSRVAMGATDQLDLLIRGSKGALAWHLMDPNWLDVYDGTQSDQPQGGKRGWQRIETIQHFPAPASLPSPLATLGWTRLHAACQFNLIDSIVKQKFNGPGIQDGLHNQAFLDAAYQSAENNQWVNLEY